MVNLAEIFFSDLQLPLQDPEHKILQDDSSTSFQPCTSNDQNHTAELGWENVTKRTRSSNKTKHGIYKTLRKYISDSVH